MGTRSPGQATRTIGQLVFDDAFPRESAGFSHDLHLDERLSFASVADLADRLPRRSVIADTAEQPLLVPQGGPPRGVLERPGDVIRDLRSANAWLTLLNVDEDPGMAEVMNTKLDQLESGMIARWGRRSKMHRRVAFIFVSSPTFGHAGPLRHRTQPVDADQWEQDSQHRPLGERRSIDGMSSTGTGTALTGGSRLCLRRRPRTP